MLILLGKSHHQSHSHPGIVQKALSAGHARSVIGVKENDRVVRQARIIQLLQLLPSDRVGPRDNVVVLSPVLSRIGVVRVVSGDANFGRVVNLLVRSNANLAFVTDGRVEDRKEGLTFRSVLEQTKDAKAERAASRSPWNGD